MPVGRSVCTPTPFTQAHTALIDRVLLSPSQLVWCRANRIGVETCHHSQINKDAQNHITVLVAGYLIAQFRNSRSNTA